MSLICYINMCPNGPSEKYPFGADDWAMANGPVAVIDRHLDGLEKRLADTGGTLRGVQVMVQWSGGRGYCEFTDDKGETRKVMADPYAEESPAWSRAVRYSAAYEEATTRNVTPLWYAWRGRERPALRRIHERTGLPPIVYDPCPAYLTADQIHARLCFLSDAGVREVVFDRTANVGDLARWKRDIEPVASMLRIRAMPEGCVNKCDPRSCMVLDNEAKDGSRHGPAYNVGTGTSAKWDQVSIVGLNLRAATAADVLRWRAKGRHVRVSVGIAQYGAVAASPDLTPGGGVTGGGA